MPALIAIRCGAVKGSQHQTMNELVLVVPFLRHHHDDIPVTVEHSLLEDTASPKHCGTISGLDMPINATNAA